ncbi:hypothetical protein, partial [Neobacillus cucumis]
ELRLFKCCHFSVLTEVNFHGSETRKRVAATTLMYITLEIGMISHILATMFFHNFISPYLVQAPVTLSALFHNFL